MNRLIVCLAVVAMSSLAVETASAQHGYRGRGHHAHHGHAVYRAPHVYHGHHAVYRAPIVRHHGHGVYGTVPLHSNYYAPYVYPQSYGSAYAYPSYGVVGHHGYPARVYVGGPAFSIRIGF